MYETKRKISRMHYDGPDYPLTGGYDTDSVALCQMMIHYYAKTT